MPRQPLRFSVGSGPQADVRIDDESIGRIAAYVTVPPKRSKAVLTDTQSVNGVWVRRWGHYKRVEKFADVGLNTPIRLGGYETTVRDLIELTDTTIDIFISYAREDTDQVVEIERALKDYGWRTWRDDKLPYGRAFDRELDERLQRAKCVLVNWSSASVASEWVRREAQVGLERGALAPVFLESIDAPAPFTTLHGCFLTEIGQARARQMTDLIAKVSTMVGKPRNRQAQGQ